MSQDIPKYHELMLPLLIAISDREVHTLRDLEILLSDQFNLTREQISRLLPSGSQPMFYNRLGWARTYLKKAGLLSQPQRGHVQITELGLSVHKEKPDKINSRYLSRFDEFRAFKNRVAPDGGDGNGEDSKTPEELLEENYQVLRDNLASELLSQIKVASPRFFENLVIDLLVRMGYGGSRKDAGQAVGRSGDGGIDGIIKEDKLGLDLIYVQAKRWENTVGRPVVQAFAGSLDGFRAKRGVLITTSEFSSEAKQYVNQIEKRIVLIDGEELAGLMIDHNVAVTPVSEYKVKKVDADYFIED